MSDIENTIFNNISSENENSVTEVLASLLRKEKFRIFLLEFFEISDINTEIFTQQNYGDNGRPDLILTSKSIKVFIENKILDKTVLTDNQPRGYLKELGQGKEKNKKLIFLLPKNYVHIEELEKRIKTFSKAVECKIKYWSELIDRLEKENKQIKSDLLTDCIIYFKNTVDVDVEETTIFDKDEFTLLNKVSKVYEYLRKIGDNWIKCNSYERKPWFCEYGIGSSYKLNNGKELFVGISPYSHYQYSFAILSKERYYEIISIEGRKFQPYCDNKKDSGGYWTYYELKSSDFDNLLELERIMRKVITKIEKK